jgi:integrase
MTDEADKTGKPEKKPEPRRVGQRKTIVAGKKYALRVFLCRDAAKKRHYHCETFHGSAGQAEDRIREIIRRHRAGEAIKANADTFGAFLDEFLASKKLSVAESSLETYRQVVDHTLRPALGARMLITVTADDVQRLYVALHEGKASRAYIRNVHAILGMIFKLAVKRKKLVGSPMAGVEIPKEWGREEDGADKRAMDADQVAKFLEAAAGTRFGNLFALAFHVGFRPGELLALKWEDFDEAARTLRVDQNIVWRTPHELRADPKLEAWYLKPPKTKSSRRTLPLQPATIAVLKAERRAQLEARMKAGKLWTDHGFIFADPIGEPYAQWTLRNDCNRILKLAGLPPTLSPKVARHTMATLLIAGGTNPKAVQERLGHSKITTTLAAYTHVLPGMQEEVSEEIERLLNAKK